MIASQNSYVIYYYFYMNIYFVLWSYFLLSLCSEYADKRFPALPTDDSLNLNLCIFLCHNLVLCLSDPSLFSIDIKGIGGGTAHIITERLSIWMTKEI